MERRWIDPLRLFISQIAFAMACRRSTHWRWASSQAIGMDDRPVPFMSAHYIRGSPSTVGEAQVPSGAAAQRERRKWASQTLVLS